MAQDQQNHDDQARARQAYQEAYFSKLAEAGIVPANEEQAQDLLTLAPKARKIAAALQRKTAASVGSLAKEANAFLDKIFNEDAAIDQLVAKLARAPKAQH